MGSFSLPDVCQGISPPWRVACAKPSSYLWSSLSPFSLSLSLFYSVQSIHHQPSNLHRLSIYPSLAHSHLPSALSYHTPEKMRDKGCRLEQDGRNSIPGTRSSSLVHAWKYSTHLLSLSLCKLSRNFLYMHAYSSPPFSFPYSVSPFANSYV